MGPVSAVVTSASRRLLYALLRFRLAARRHSRDRRVLKDFEAPTNFRIADSVESSVREIPT